MPSVEELQKQQQDILTRIRETQENRRDPITGQSYAGPGGGRTMGNLFSVLQKDYLRLQYEIQEANAKRQVEQGVITEEQARSALDRAGANQRASTRPNPSPLAGAQLSRLPGSVRTAEAQGFHEEAKALTERATRAQSEGKSQEAAQYRDAARAKEEQAVQAQQRANDGRQGVRERIFERPTAVQELGKPATEIDFQTKGGRTQSVVRDVPDLTPTIGADQGFAGKAATVAGLEVRTGVVALREENGALRPAGRINTVYAPESVIYGPTVNQGLASRNPKNPFNPNSKEGFLDFLTKGEQAKNLEQNTAQAKLFSASTAAAKLFSEGEGYESPFVPGVKLVTVDGITFQATPDIGQRLERIGKEKGYAKPTYLKEAEAAITQTERVKRISDAKKRTFLERARRGEETLQSVNLRIKELEKKSTQQIGNQAKNNLQANKNKEDDYSGNNGFLKTVSTFNSRDVLTPKIDHTGENGQTGFKKLSGLTTNEKLELGFKKGYVKPYLETSYEEGGKDVVYFGVATGVFISAVAVAPIATLVFGGALATADFALDLTKTTADVTQGKDLAYTAGERGPTLLLKGALSALGVRDASLAAEAVASRVSQVESVDVLGKTSRVVSREGVAGPTPLEVQQKVIAQANVKTTTRNYLGEIVSVERKPVFFQVTQEGEGLSASELARVKSIIEGGKIAPDYSATLTNPVKQISEPTFKPQGETFKVGEQLAQVTKVKDQTIVTSYDTVRSPDYSADLIQNRKLRRSFPAQKEQKFATYGKTESFTTEAGEVKTRTLRLITKEGERTVNINRRYFTPDELKNINVPKGKVVGVGAEEGSQLTEFSQLPARPIIKVRDVTTPDVTDVFTGKPILKGTVEVEAGFEGGTTSTYSTVEGQYFNTGDANAPQLAPEFSVKSKKPILNSSRDQQKLRRIVNDVIEQQDDLFPKKNKNLLGAPQKSNVLGKNAESEPTSGLLTQLDEQKQAKVLKNADVAQATQVNPETPNTVARRLFNSKRSYKIETSGLAGLAGASAATDILTRKPQVKTVPKVNTLPKVTTLPKQVTPQKTTTKREFLPTVKTGFKTLPNVNTGQKSGVTQTPQQRTTPRTTTPTTPTPGKPGTPRPIIPKVPDIPGFKFNGGFGEKPRYDSRNPYTGLRQNKLKTVKQYFGSLAGSRSQPKKQKVGFGRVGVKLAGFGNKRRLRL